jgi:low temperature requirement protein LtrA
MIEEIVKRLLESLGGFDFWIAIVALVLSTVVWFFVGSKNKAEKKKLKRQLTMVATVIALAVGVIWIRHLIPPKPFPQNVAGILILRIAGDDSVGSFQSRLVSSLNAELASIAASQRIEVWADDESVDEKRGLDESHKEARGLGEKRNALLVIWGNKVDDIRFFPRITIVRCLTFACVRWLVSSLVPPELNPCSPVFIGG